MDPEARAQLIEDIDRSATLRRNIAEQARLSPAFDIEAAWEEVEDLETTIAKALTSLRAR